MPHIVSILSKVPDMVQKWFCTQNEDMDVTFKMRHVPNFYYYHTQCYEAKIVTHSFENPMINSQKFKILI